MNKIQKVEKQIAALEADISRLNQERTVLLKNTYVTCLVCNKRSKIKTIPAIEVYVYKDELYNERNVLATIYLVCPKCKEVLRLEHSPNAKVTHGKLPELYRMCGKTFKAYNESECHYASFPDTLKKAIEWIEKKDR